MSKVGKIQQKTHNRFLNFFEFEAIHRSGAATPYYVSSRAKTIPELKAVSGRNDPDGVCLYGIYGEKKDKMVLLRQYRYPLADYVYELPAGLVEPGEDMLSAAVREMYEETGLTFSPVEAGFRSRPFFTTIGMTDESCGTVFGYCSGVPTSANQEDTEEIQVVLADRAECRRILKEENVAIMCAYMLMHFIAAQGDPLAFLKEYRIRQMHPEDADAKAYVHWKSWQETYSDLMDAEHLIRLDSAQQIAHRFPQNTLIAEQYGNVVGFACYRTDDSGSGTVQALYVLKEFQGQGLGRALLDAVLERLSGYSPITLGVLDKNTRAIGFYEHYGFRKTGQSASHPYGTEIFMTYQPE